MRSAEKQKAVPVVVEGASVRVQAYGAIALCMPEGGINPKGFVE